MIGSVSLDPLDPRGAGISGGMRRHANVLPLRSCRAGPESAIPSHMRMPVLAVLLSLNALPCAAAQAPRAADPAALEQAWRDCVREAYAHQPPAQGRAGSQRNALDECKEREDAVVAALMAARDVEAGRDARSLPARARAWAASVAAYVVDPVSSWIAMLRN